jgi:ketosteroid isomerase-like protein
VSDSDVRLVLGVFDAINRRDIAAVLDSHAHDARMITLTSASLQGGGYEGHDGIKEYFSSVVDVWTDVKLVAEEVFELDDAVLVRGHWYSRGRGSGADVSAPAAWLYTIKDGKISWSKAFRDVDEALASLRAGPPDIRRVSTLPFHPPTTT